MTRRNLFIAGVPATGKTWLGQWLAEKHGYTHIDAERDGGADLDSAGAHNAWDAIFQTRHAAAFVEAIRRLPNPVVVSWGLDPSRYLYVVSALQAEGVETWWLNAPRGRAREAFRIRGTGDLGLFDYQMNAIDREWPRIEAVFGSHIVQAYGVNGSQRTPNALWDEMSAKR